jgi:hypothetical protein
MDVRAACVVATILLAGCTSATPIYDGQGQPALLISCDGMAQPLSNCYERATEECPQGYVLLDQQNTTQGFVAGPYGASAMNHKSIAVRCKPATAS